jgi:DNA-binding response OmpR family regulator
MWCSYDPVTILIVDEDLRFAFWLGRLLIGAGYRAWPARTGPDAITLLNEMGGKLDLLVVNPYSRGAEDLVDALRLHRKFKAIATRRRDEAPVLEGMDAALVKPHPIDALSAIEWIDAIDRVLAS